VALKNAQEFHKNFESLVSGDSIPNTLCHYTDYNGMKGVFLNREFWLTNSYFTNDRSEFSGGYNLLLDALKTTKRFSSGVKRDKILPLLLSHIEENSLADIFIASFSSLCDNLSQWRAYGRNGRGYMLEFEADEIRKVKNSWGERQQLAGQVYFQEVLYDQTKKIEKINKFFDLIFPILEAALKVDDDKNLPGIALGEMFVGFCGYAYSLISSFKDASFSDEKEYRLVAVYLFNKTQLDIGMYSTADPFFRGSEYPIPYVRASPYDIPITGEVLPLVEGAKRFKIQMQIKKIMIGPCRDDIALTGLRRFVSTRSEFKTEVVKSYTPYRA